MPITAPTPYTGGPLPDDADPLTFDGRMTPFAAWWKVAIDEIDVMVTELNTALNDNGTVLDATAEATRRATNSVVPALTTGSGSAYVVSASVTVPALAADEPVAIRAHVGNSGAATLDVDGLGAVALRKIDDTGATVALAGGEIAPFDEHVFVYDGTYWVMQTQPLRPLIAGQVLDPLPSQTGNFNALIEGGEHEISGSWTNGPLGAGANTYTGVCKTMISDSFAHQELRVDGDAWERTGTGSGPTWGSWTAIGLQLGDSQTWQDVSGSRAGGTSYQNTTGRTIAIGIVASSAANLTLEVSTDNSSWVDVSGHSTAGRVPLHATIPDGHYYRVTGVATIFSWSELR